MISVEPHSSYGSRNIRHALLVMQSPDFGVLL